MEKDKKDAIIAAGLDYMARHGMNQADLARHCGVNPSYMNVMVSGVYTYKAGKGKITEISDKYFNAVASAIGYEVEKTFWKVEQTPQFITAIAALHRAHLSCTARMGGVKMIIGEIGSGKPPLSSSTASKTPPRRCASPSTTWTRSMTYSTRSPAWGSNCPSRRAPACAASGRSSA